MSLQSDPKRAARLFWDAKAVGVPICWYPLEEKWVSWCCRARVLNVAGRTERGGEIHWKRKCSECKRDCEFTWAERYEVYKAEMQRMEAGAA